MINQRCWHNNKTHLKKSDVKKKKKVKVTHDFVVNKETMNTIIIKENENNA